VDIVDEDFAVLDAREAVAQVHAAFADGLHLGAQQHEARLEGVQQVEIVERLPVLGDAALRFFAFGLFSHNET
jgi:hypothetical protein